MVMGTMLAYAIHMAILPSRRSTFERLRTLISTGRATPKVLIASPPGVGREREKHMPNPRCGSECENESARHLWPALRGPRFAGAPQVR